jgi:hypothetical protein
MNCSVAVLRGPLRRNKRTSNEKKLLFNKRAIRDLQATGPDIVLMRKLREETMPPPPHPLLPPPMYMCTETVKLNSPYELLRVLFFLLREQSPKDLRSKIEVLCECFHGGIDFICLLGLCTV